MTNYYVVLDLLKSRKETQGPMSLFDALTIMEKDKVSIAGGEAFWESIKDRFTHDVCGGSDYPEDSVEYFLKPYIIAAYVAGRNERK